MYLSDHGINYSFSRSIQGRQAFCIFSSSCWKYLQQTWCEGVYNSLLNIFCFLSFLFYLPLQSPCEIYNQYWQVFMESCPFLNDQITKSFPLAFLLVIDQITLIVSLKYSLVYPGYAQYFHSIFFLDPSLQKAWAETKLILINAFILFLSWKSNQLDAGTKSSRRNCRLEVGKTSKFSFS